MRYKNANVTLRVQLFVFDKNDKVGARQHLKLVRCHQHCTALVPQLTYAAIEDVLANVRIQGGQHVVKDVNIRFVVHGPRNGDTRFLTSAEVDSPLPYLRSIAIGHLRQVLV